MFVWDRFFFLFQGFLTSPCPPPKMAAAASSFIINGPVRRSVTSLCASGQSADPGGFLGEESPRVEQEGGGMAQEGGRQKGGGGVGVAAAAAVGGPDAQHCSDSMKPSFSWPTGSTSA